MAVQGCGTPRVVRSIKGEFFMSGRLTLIALAACVASATQAQQCPPVVRAPKVDFSKVEIRTTRLADDFFTLEGHGGTISVLTGPDGVLMVDSQFAPLTDKIVAAIRQFPTNRFAFLSTRMFTPITPAATRISPSSAR